MKSSLFRKVAISEELPKTGGRYLAGYGDTIVQADYDEKNKVFRTEEVTQTKCGTETSVKESPDFEFWFKNLERPKIAVCMSMSSSYYDSVKHILTDSQKSDPGMNFFVGTNVMFDFLNGDLNVKP